MASLFFVLDEMSAMFRNPDACRNKSYDIVIVGAGINGAGLAWEASSRGFKTLLIDRADFGGATSSGCFKIIHGGLRYLQHLNFARAFESIQEQRALRKLAPHLVHPLPFLVPCYGYAKRGKPFLTAGLCLYELIASNRNYGVQDSHHLPRFRSMSQEETLAIAPGIDSVNLSGGLVFYDCQMSNCERLTLAVVRAAQDAGADVLNYVEAEGAELKWSGEARATIRSLKCVDRLSGFQFSIAGKVFVDATGPSSFQFLKRIYGDIPSESPYQKKRYFSKGVQLVLPEMVKGYGLALQSNFADRSTRVSRGGRNYFLTPWRECSLLGTSDVLEENASGDFRTDSKEIEDLLANAREFYQSEYLKKEHVRFVFGGLRPLIEEIDLAGASNETAKASLSEKILEHKQPVALCYFGKQILNLHTLEGVKYTTFRAFAKKALDGIVSSDFAEERIVSAQTSTSPMLPGGEIADYPDFVQRKYESMADLFDLKSLSYLITNFGTDIEKIEEIARQKPEFAENLESGVLATKAEMIYCIRNESVCHLNDLIFRRTGLGSLGHPGSSVIRVVAELAAEELGWSEEQMLEEIQSVESVFDF